MTDSPKERWGDGQRYDRYMGRWSRLLAPKFLAWLNPSAGLRWLDVGCGTGNLAAAIQQQSSPNFVAAFDPAEAFVVHAAAQTGAKGDGIRDSISDQPVRYGVASAQALPLRSASFDLVVAGLVLNFVPSVSHALDEMRRVASAQGRVGAYLWDYAEGMGMLRTFFDAAIAVDPDAVAHDEGRRFPICRPDALHAAFYQAGMQELAVAPIACTAHFVDFDDYWQPFVSGARFPAAAWLMSRPEATRAGIRDHLRGSLPFAADGSIDLTLRAWAAVGTVP